MNYMSGKHEKKRRRWLPWTVGVVVLAMASVAVAVLISVRSSAPQTVTARSIGSVDIGDAETLGVWLGDLENVSAGFKTCQRVTAVLTDPSELDIPRLYVTEASGEFGDVMRIVVSQRPATAGETAGHSECADETDSTFGGTEIYQGFVNAGTPSGDMGVAAGIGSDWASGTPWADSVATTFSMRLVVPTDVGEPSLYQGQSTTLAFAWENRDE